MAMRVEMRKLSEDGRAARYGFGPEDDKRGAIFRAAAGKLAKIWSEQGEIPDTAVYQA
ncbi:MAG TPA: hypothetical protein VG756_10520 [Pseudonocardiaceae bacterium]|jgi:hypothetical protein|nr:hypothetical protein [Pseudonocardiaceae bacterium]